jgi:DNA-binding MarR family transcriptional regulator
MSAKVARECWEAIYRLVFEGEAQDRMATVCSHAGLAPGVVKTLIHLAPDEPTPMRDLAEHFRFDPSYITALVDGLEQAGLAERQMLPTDRRVKTIVLTGKGREIQQQVFDLMLAPPKCLDALSTVEQRQLRELLEKAAAADAYLAAEGAGLNGYLGIAARPGRAARPRSTAKATASA